MDCESLTKREIREMLDATIHTCWISSQDKIRIETWDPSADDGWMELSLADGPDGAYSTTRNIEGSGPNG